MSPTASSTAMTQRRRQTGSRAQRARSPCARSAYVDALARAGRLDDARLTFEKMFTYANHLGLYSEEIALTGEQIRQLPAGFHSPVPDRCLAVHAVTPIRQARGNGRHRGLVPSSPSAIAPRGACRGQPTALSSARLRQPGRRSSTVMPRKARHDGVGRESGPTSRSGRSLRSQRSRDITGQLPSSSQRGLTRRRAFSWKRTGRWRRGTPDLLRRAGDGLSATSVLPAPARYARPARQARAGPLLSRGGRCPRSVGAVATAASRVRALFLRWLQCCHGAVQRRVGARSPRRHGVLMSRPWAVTAQMTKTSNAMMVRLQMG